MEKNVVEVKLSLNSNSIEVLNDLNEWINKKTEKVKQVLSEKTFISDVTAGYLDAYETDLVVKDLIGVLKSRGVAIGEAERLLDRAKAELKHARLVTDDRIISAQL